jgi:3-oxoacyl-[acyl-carrier protein] reductase
MVAFVIKQFGSIFGVVHNAAPLIVHSDFMGLEWKQIQSDIDVHVKGAFNLCHEVLPYLTEQKNGCIVNVTSIYADNVPPPKLFSYVMAKSALAAFSRSLAVEYGPMNIRINCVAPGMTETDLIADVPEKTKLLNKMQTPLRRLAAPEDIAGAIIFLFSDKARHITGETIRVCGGMVML